MRISSSMILILTSLIMTSVLGYSADEWEARGDSYYKSGNYEKSLECYDKAIRADNSSAEIWYKKYLSLREIGKDNEAQESRNEAIRRDPSYLSATSEGDRLDIVPYGMKNNANVITFDFETGDLMGWNKTGNAFDFQPTFGDNPAYRNQGHVNFQGKYWIGTYEKYTGSDGPNSPGSIQGEEATGTLSSLPFIIKGDKMSFLLGGGENCSINLIINNTTVLTSSGKNDDRMEIIEWNVSSFMNETVFIRLVDNSSGKWGHINFDDMRFDIPPSLYEYPSKPEISIIKGVDIPLEIKPL